MTNTTYYNLNIVDGTDIVNPLTVDNPNYEKIDQVMHDNAVSGVTLATEIANSTVHAITRENSECAVIRFIATSIWKAGDTITVDGVSVTALLPSGETLPEGAYVINANVLCILTGTNLTVYADRKKIDNASEIKYNDTNVAAAITEINNNLNTMIKNVSTSGSNDYVMANAGFWSQGHFQIHIIDNSVIYVSINVISTKNSNDWIFMFREEYRPLYTFHFDYYLGDVKYRGYINPDDGAVRFETLNTEDVISCSFCFPIK